MDEKDILLQELNKYIDISSGRKRRNDIGKPRHIYNNKPYQSKEHIYNRVKAKLLNRDEKLKADDNYLLSVEFDEQGLYRPIPEMYKTINSYYEQNINGRIAHHTVARKRVQKAIDLERYRFEAWQEKALNTPDAIVESSPDIKGILLYRCGFTPEQAEQAIINRQVNWLTFFAEVYFINVNDAAHWDYETWREYYDCCPTDELTDDFEFIYGVKPGTEYCHPEWAYKALRAKENKELDETNKIEQKKILFTNNMKRR